jgi:hypothetical protein
MSVIERNPDKSTTWSFVANTGFANLNNVWVELAWTVLEVAGVFGNDEAIAACQKAINDGSNGDLPAQSDLNVIFGFVDAHAH